MSFGRDFDFTVIPIVSKQVSPVQLWSRHSSFWKTKVGCLACSLVPAVGLALHGFWYILLKCLHSLLLFLSTHTNPSEENVIVVRLSWSIVLDRKALKDTIRSICSLSVGCRGYNCTVICTIASQETCDTTWSHFYPCKSGGFWKQV